MMSSSPTEYAEKTSHCDSATVRVIISSRGAAPLLTHDEVRGLWMATSDSRRTNAFEAAVAARATCVSTASILSLLQAHAKGAWAVSALGSLTGRHGERQRGGGHGWAHDATLQSWQGGQCVVRHCGVQSVRRRR
jgi:hypothetical protein